MIRQHVFTVKQLVDFINLHLRSDDEIYDSHGESGILIEKNSFNNLIVGGKRYE